MLDLSSLLKYDSIMSNTFWEYVDDEILITEIKNVLQQFEQEMESVDIHRNVLDPFSALFDMAKQGIDFEEWLEQEKSRQSQKTLQNLVGYFHQHILGAVGDWEDPGTGGSVDLINDREKIIVEIKNKHNTLNSSSATQTYNKMVGHLNNSKLGYQGYVVLLIPKRPRRYKKHFAPNDDGVPVERRDDLMEIDGASIYEIVTKDKDALKKLYACLPDAIEAALPGLDFSIDAGLRGEFKKLFVRAFGD